jgi:DNA-directed RNA polymerases I and III subunit RPAC1
VGPRTIECGPDVDDYEEEYVISFVLIYYIYIKRFFFMILFSGSTDQAMDRNTVVFQVDLTCERNPNAPKGSTNDHELYINHELLSSHLVWVPAGEQEEVFAGKPPAPINPNIVLAKLRPGQRVSMELHAVKGVGKDHAKFCPVGTFPSYLLTNQNFH